jgi:peptide/nickel transport system permease protein
LVLEAAQVWRYLVQRSLAALLTVFLVSVAVFVSLQFIPGDVAEAALGIHSTEEARAALRHKLGLDQPPIRQYTRWLVGVLHGDLGESLRTQEPVGDAVRQRLPVTAELALLGSALAIGLGIPAGIIAAVRQYSTADQVSSAVAMLGLSIPDFWLATLLILAFAQGARWLPSSGLLPSLFEDPGGHMKRMLMPALSLGLPSAALYYRMTRSAMLEVIRADYMRTAYSKGLNERRAILVHALKNAMIPVVTAGGLDIAWMLGGSFIVETVFSLPGLGRGTVIAIYDRDYTLLQGCLLVYSVVVVLITFITDLSYAYLDPRIHYG